MTQEQKQAIYNLRIDGLGYKAIASTLGISRDSVKAYCKRNHLQGSPDVVTLNVAELDTNKILCRHCHNPIKKKRTGRKGRFCSEACRRKWWNEHRDQTRKSDAAVTSGACAHCGEAFTAYGNPNRKYCSRACYFAERFGRDKHGIREAEN